MTACPFTAPGLANKRAAAHALNKHTGPKGTTLRHGRDLAAGLGKNENFCSGEPPPGLPAREGYRKGWWTQCMPPAPRHRRRRTVDPWALISGQ